MVPLSKTAKSIPFAGEAPSAKKLDVHTTLTDPRAVSGAAAASRSCGRTSSVNSKVAIQCIPTIASNLWAVLAPASTRFAPVPALFQRTSSLDSCCAKVVRLTVSKSLRSRWRNLILPGDFGAG